MIVSIRARRVLALAAALVMPLMVGEMPAALAETPVDTRDAPSIDGLAPDPQPENIEKAPEADANAATEPSPEPAQGDDDTLSVTVRARLPRTLTSATMTLGRQELEAAPARNAEELLRQVPGLTLIQHGSEGKGHQFFLRGFDAVHGADLELTLGGVPLNEWSGIHGQGYIDLGVILPEVVEGMHVIKGPFALHQGLFGMAGTVDYRPGISPRFLEGDALQNQVAVTAGSTGRLRAFGRRTSADGASFAAAEVMRDAGYGEQRDIERATLNVGTSDVSLWGGTLSVWLVGGASRFELPGTLRTEDVEAGRVGFYDAYEDLGRGRSARTIGAASWQRSGALAEGDLLRVRVDGGARDLELFENFTGYLDDPIQGDRTRQAHRAYGGGADLFYLRPLLKRLSFVGGAHLRAEHVEQSERAVDADLASTSTLRALRGVQSSMGARAGLRLSPTPALRLDLGGRLDAVALRATDTRSAATAAATAPGNSELLLAASPRATARWTPHTRWMFFGAYGRGLRPPELRGFAGAAPDAAGSGDGAPTIAQSHAAELGARYFPTDWLGITLSGFATQLSREIFFDHLAGTTIELDASRRLGAEIFFDIHPADWMHLSADVTWVDARFTDTGQPVPQVPTLTAGAHWVVFHPSGLGGGLRFLGVAPRNLPAGGRSGTLTRFDATLSYQWQHWRVGLEVENLLNQRLREGEYVYASDWRATEGGSRLPALHQSAGPPLNGRLTVSADF